MQERLAELLRAFEAAIAGDGAAWREALGRARWDEELAALVPLVERVFEDLDAFRRDREHFEAKERLAAAGALAGAMATSLAAPLARVREALGQTCDLLDKHVAHSKGPDPLPRHQVSRVREVLADVYMDASRCARLAADLAAVVAPAGTPPPGGLDLNEIVERAVALAGHKVSDDSDLLLDLGSIPTVPIEGSRLAQAIAHILIDAAESVGRGGSIVVRTFEDGDDVAISVVHAPPGPLRSTFAALVRDTIAAQGGRLRFERDESRAVAELRFARTAGLSSKPA